MSCCQKGGERPGVVVRACKGGGGYRSIAARRRRVLGVDLGRGCAWLPLPRRGPMLVVFQMTQTLGGTAEGANREKRRSVDSR